MVGNLKRQDDMKDWIWLPHAQHFCAADSCLFRLATLLPNGYVVSSVGEYRYNNEQRDIGYKRKYETMVFKTIPNQKQECGCPNIQSYENLDFAGANDSTTAIKNHYDLCRKWEQLEGNKNEIL